MSLVVEDGTGLSTAQSYLSVADADAYHLTRNNTAWALASTADKEFALIRGTEAIDRNWFGRFIGTKYSSTQALSWPRTDAVDKDGFDLSSSVPMYLERATAEAALIELDTPGALSPETERGGAIKEENIAGAVKIVYQDWAAANTQYSALNNAIAPLLVSSGGAITILRA